MYIYMIYFIGHGACCSICTAQGNHSFAFQHTGKRFHHTFCTCLHLIHFISPCNWNCCIDLADYILAWFHSTEHRERGMTIFLEHICGHTISANISNLCDVVLSRKEGVEWGECWNGINYRGARHFSLLVTSYEMDFCYKMRPHLPGTLIVLSWHALVATNAPTCGTSQTEPYRQPIQHAF